MQLGNFLTTAAEPVVGRAVSFRVLGEDQTGRQISAKAEAVLAFVDEERREEYKRFAREWLESHDYKAVDKDGRPYAKPIPLDVLTDEEYRWFVLAALRDKDAPERQFCPNSDYGRFRKALILEQITWLKAEYDRFVKDEYPELATKQQQQQLLEESAGK